MTKKEWSNLIVGSKVKTEYNDIDRSQEPPTLIKKVSLGEVIKFNFGCSQVLVKYESGTEIWKGRLGIEVVS